MASLMRWLVAAVFALALGPILMAVPVLGMLSSSPWSPWWFAERSAATIDVGGRPSAVDVPAIAHGFVSDVERYRLARAAGFSPQEAIIATAISIAEDGSGDPAALSGLNFNGTRDLGLWQINSSHWPAHGGPAALVDPFTNARAAFAIYGPAHNWCAWSTFEAGCGPGHTSAYVAFLGRARAAAEQG